MKTNFTFVSLFGVTQIKTLFFYKNIKTKICPLLRIVGHFFCTRPKHNQYSLLGGCLRGFRPLSIKTLKLTLLNVIKTQHFLFTAKLIIQLIWEIRRVFVLFQGEGGKHLTSPNLFPIYLKNKVYVYN